ncbi:PLASMODESMATA CALLOSE-BINDING PROTEIN 2 isoform X2 [Zea mays]|uniref:Carbohydrate-binding X8 domain superfamily protein n=1 Tax=Zea mays TaxID=4577 RepID=A0A1D6MDU4_MAIZE|nr:PLASMODESMATA CALLOSE-BINDING PROTEIN 2 isoform X2 [Zea mays]AQK88822.1 Carbohydrate-binding X8 domain superfamily protein [Zea mays]|eukprot:XP_008650071.1 PLASMODESMATA CALLOSE-BINDING PROTEIN 2 isoform X2 [Zea mays]
MALPLRPVHGLASLLLLLLVLLSCNCHCHGGGSERGAGATKRLERDVTSPLATVPVVNPTATMPLPTATPAAPSLPLATGAGGGSWCVASPSAGAAVLQVALNYACGQGGADCSAVQRGGSCFSPDTVPDHASYAFNTYYQKNPVQTSCDFGGAAVLTTTNPSTSTCQYPATSTGASVLNTSTPLTPGYGSAPGGYGSSPPAGDGRSPPLYGNMSPPDYGDNTSAAVTVRALPGRKTAAAVVALATTSTWLLIALTVSG